MPTFTPLTTEQLAQIVPDLSKAKAEEILPYLNGAMREFEINTPIRVAAFVSQIAHETGGFKWFKEIWGPTPQQEKYDPPGKLAEGLGNTQKGDGKRYRGRGAIQLTGRHNYQLFGKLLGLDLEKSPERAEDIPVAFRIAGCFWKTNGLNPLADGNLYQAITKRINGGYTGMADRLHYYERARIALGIYR